MIRRFNDHFVRADAVHLVEQAFAFAVQIAFDPQRGKFIRDHAHVPARRIWAAAVSSVLQNLRRRLRFVARAKRDTSGCP